VRVLAIQCDRVERSRQASRRLSLRQVMEASIGTLWRALTCEHARGILAKPSIRVHTSGVRIGSREVFLLEERQQFTPVAKVRGRNLGDLLVAQGFAVVVTRDFPAAHCVRVLLRANTLAARRPFAQQCN